MNNLFKTTLQAGTLSPAPIGKPPSSGVLLHTVQSGESLQDIAHKYYGNGVLWTHIYNANKGLIGGNANKLTAGQQLVVPPGA